jgi:hypothetical protein
MLVYQRVGLRPQKNGLFEKVGGPQPPNLAWTNPSGVAHAGDEGISDIKIGTLNILKTPPVPFPSDLRQLEMTDVYRSQKATGRLQKTSSAIIYYIYYIHIYIYTYKYRYTCLFIYLFTFFLCFIYAHIYLYIYIDIHIYIYLYIHMCIYIYMYIYICIYVLFSIFIL